MQQTLMEQGLNLMIYGMGAVFVFLTLLVICTFIMSRAVSLLFPEAPEPVEPPASAGAQAVDRKTLAIIRAAIQEHRAKQGRR